MFTNVVFPNTVCTPLMRRRVISRIDLSNSITLVPCTSSDIPSLACNDRKSLIIKSLRNLLRRTWQLCVPVMSWPRLRWPLARIGFRFVYIAVGALLPVFATGQTLNSLSSAEHTLASERARQVIGALTRDAPSTDSNALSGADAIQLLALELRPPAKASGSNQPRFAI